MTSKIFFLGTVSYKDPWAASIPDIRVSLRRGPHTSAISDLSKSRIYPLTNCTPDAIATRKQDCFTPPDNDVINYIIAAISRQFARAPYIRRTSWTSSCQLARYAPQIDHAQLPHAAARLPDR